MTPRVLLIGGHGKISLLLTPMLLARSWHVTSLIRDASQTSDILSQSHSQPGQLDVLVRSLEDVKSDDDAQKVLDEVKPDYVVWSAGNTALPKLLPNRTDTACSHPTHRSRRQRRLGPHLRHRPRRRQALHQQRPRHAVRLQVPHGLVPRQPAEPSAMVGRRRVGVESEGQRGGSTALSRRESRRGRAPSGVGETAT